jgi:hypothetical protein
LIAGRHGQGTAYNGVVHPGSAPDRDGGSVPFAATESSKLGKAVVPYHAVVAYRLTRNAE